MLWRWFVISDHWCYYCNYLGATQWHTFKSANLIDKYVCSDCSTDQLIPSLSPTASAHSLFLRLNCVKLGQLIMQWPLSVQMWGRVAFSHFKSKAGNRLRRKLRSTLKAKAGGKPGFLYQLARGWLNVKRSSGRKVKCYSSEYIWVIGKQKQPCYWCEKSLLMHRISN